VLVMVLILASRAYAVDGCNKRVLVIGGSSGIGLAVVQQYDKQRGACVHVTTRSLNQTERNHARYKLSTRTTFHKLDVTNETEISHLAVQFKEDGAVFDVLFYSAGTNKGNYTYQSDVNARAVYRVISALLPSLEPSEHRRLCIITSSMGTQSVIDRKTQRLGGVCDTDDWCAYPKSKHLSNKMFAEYELQWRESKFKAVLLQPGQVATRMTGFRGIAPAKSAKGLVRACDRFGDDARGKMLDWQRRVIPLDI